MKGKIEKTKDYNLVHTRHKDNWKTVMIKCSGIVEGIPGILIGSWLSRAKLMVKCSDLWQKGKGTCSSSWWDYDIMVCRLIKYCD